MQLPKKKYNVIYADPPWSYRNAGLDNSAATKYVTMTDKDICELPISDIAADDCVLFMWATYPKIDVALEVIKAWGFQYKTIGFQWIKQNKSRNGNVIGLGWWTRGNTEPCLIAVKGHPKRDKANISQLVFSPIRERSRKPDEVRDKIVELMGDMPRIELFSRTTTPGWDCWGNETDKFKTTETTEDDDWMS